MLIDSARIHVAGGRGGDGCVSFRRMKYIPKGGPDGGDGGNGGDVIAVADPQVTTLLDFAGRHHWHAENGGPGLGSSCHGKSGGNLTVPLPAGTLIYDENDDSLLVDLDAPGSTAILAHGGKGGLGNEYFKSATNQTPRQSTPGEPGEERTLRLELKLIADIGLVGLPNAGKSTLLARVTKATPKVGDYPFTTLEPYPGVCELPGTRRMVVADIPGLIERAHAGAGLGTRFLRHIERTRLLLHLIDIDPHDGSDPVTNHKIICNELASYGHGLAEKPMVTAVTKADLLGDASDAQAAQSLLSEAIGQPVYAISSATGQGIDELLEACWQMLPDQHAGADHARWTSET